MSSTGCGFLLLAIIALFAGMIPFLAWTNLVVTLPLALIALVSTGAQAIKPNAQPADKAMLGISVLFVVIVAARMAIL